MNYVNSLNIFGTEAKEIPCIKLHSPPTESTIGAVGLLYMDIDNGNIYKCISVENGSYIWKRMLDTDDRLDNDSSLYNKIEFENGAYEIISKHNNTGEHYELSLSATGKDNDGGAKLSICAPSDNSKKSVLSLKTEDQNTDFTSVHQINNNSQGSVSILNKTSGDIVIPPVFSVDYNNGDNNNVSRFIVNPDAITTELTSRGIKVRKNNKYSNDSNNNQEVTIDLFELNHKVNKIYNALINNGTITEDSAAISSPYLPNMEIGNILTTGAVDDESRMYQRTIDYIPCSENVLYTFIQSRRIPCRVIFYDNNKEFIVSQNVTSGNNIVSPENCAFMRIVYNSNCLSDTLTITW